MSASRNRSRSWEERSTALLRTSMLGTSRVRGLVVPAAMPAMPAGLTGPTSVAMLEVARGGDGMQTGNERQGRIAGQEPLDQGAERLTGPGPEHQLTLVHAGRSEVDLEAAAGAERLD